MAMIINKLDNNGNYASLRMGSTGGNVLPLAIMQYMSGYSASTGGMVLMLAIAQGENQRTTKKEYCAIFTLNAQLEPKSFEQYMKTILETDIMPFLSSKEIDLIDLEFFYAIPKEFRDLGKGGPITVEIKSKELTSVIHQALKDVLNRTPEQVIDAEEMFELIGAYRADCAVDEGDMKKVKHILDKLNIKYDLYD